MNTDLISEIIDEGVVSKQKLTERTRWKVIQCVGKNTIDEGRNLFRI